MAMSPAEDLIVMTAAAARWQGRLAKAGAEYLDDAASPCIADGMSGAIMHDLNEAEDMNMENIPGLIGEQMGFPRDTLSFGNEPSRPERRIAEAGAVSAGFAAVGATAREGSL